MPNLSQPNVCLGGIGIRLYQQLTSLVVHLNVGNAQNCADITFSNVFQGAGIHYIVVTYNQESDLSTPQLKVWSAMVPEEFSDGNFVGPKVWPTPVERTGSTPVGAQLNNIQLSDWQGTAENDIFQQVPQTIGIALVNFRVALTKLLFSPSA
jgi:hypothetical protein